VLLERDKDKTIDYVLFWLEYGGKAIKEEPNGQGGVHHWTAENVSGGYTGWEEPMSQVYFKPRTLDEKLLQGQVHEYMLLALAWALDYAEEVTPPDTPFTMWTAMDLSEAYRIAHMVVYVDPSLAAGLKIRINKICLRMGLSLSEQVSAGFKNFMGHTELDW
jgi:hypothetical protein